MKTTMTIMLLFTLIGYMRAQETKSSIEPPHFDGGEKQLEAYLNQHLIYPETAKRQGIEGLVKVNVRVGKDGRFGNLNVVKSLSKDLDNEALRLISNMPAWIPAKKEGRPAGVKYQLAIRFRLD